MSLASKLWIWGLSKIEPKSPEIVCFKIYKEKMEKKQGAASLKR
jgi:hypothetical protein